MNDKYCLVLRLEGPLQSWGERSHWDYRDTALMPTKSGIVGLIASAFGWGRGDSRIPELASSFDMAIRADRPGELMVDYHTITFEDGQKFTAEGKVKRDGPIVTHRSYLQDACFTVFLVGKKEDLEVIEDALHNPVWILYLGRKSCPPSRPIVCDGVKPFDNLENLVQNEYLSDRHNNSMPIEIDEKLWDGSGLRLWRPDEVVDVYRTFGNRTVVKTVV